ncbi:uncharacterized protein LOC135808287 [Sycon ciliatum]|uniref:uncharacterized protein LOC135808287 n=1 Tax=Sycon ciliatum TaxID=27933 RepID=UPI0031F685B5
MTSKHFVVPLSEEQQPQSVIDSLLSFGDEMASEWGSYLKSLLWADSPDPDNEPDSVPAALLEHDVWPHEMKHQCRAMRDCWRFVVNELELEGLRDVFDHRFDHCYCKECRSTTAEITERGDEVYVLPDGWCRFGLNPRAMIEQYGGDTSIVNVMFDRRESSGWPVGFHGSHPRHIRSILNEGRLLKPSQRTKTGTEITVTHVCTIGGLQAPAEVYERIFFSPSIRYCEWYCKQPPASTHLCVLQARIRKSMADVGHETLAGRVEDKYVERHEMEWSVKDGIHTPLYGLLIRERPEQFFFR